MEDTKRIVTKVVIGRRIQTFRKIIRMTSDEEEAHPRVLGCTVCGGHVSDYFVERGKGKNREINIKIKLDIHIWYQLGGDTSVAKMSTEVVDSIEITNQGPEDLSLEEAYVWMKEEPECVDTTLITNPECNLMAVQIEYTLGAEVIAETVLDVKVFNT